MKDFKAISRSITSPDLLFHFISLLDVLNDSFCELKSVDLQASSVAYYFFFHLCIFYVLTVCCALVNCSNFQNHVL